MALAQRTDVVIDGETFDLVTIPDAQSKMVQKAKESLLGFLDLASLVSDLGKLGNFIRVAYNGVAGNTEIQIKVQKVGYKITKLADKSAITVGSFKRTSQDVLQELQSTYEYLLDGMETFALETLSCLTTVAADMAKAAEELHNDFEEATEDVVKALEDTQRAKDTQEERKRTLEEEREKFEMRKLQAEELQKSALEEEENAKAFYNEAQAREDKAMDAQKSMDAQEVSWRKDLLNAFTGVTGAAASAMMLDFKKAAEKLKQIGDKTAYKEAMRMAYQEKMKHLDNMQKQQDIRRDAILQCIEFTEKIKNCKDDDALADAAIEALHSSIGALKSLSAIMMNAALFWQHMQKHCEALAKGDMKKKVEKAMEDPKENRAGVWTSKPFMKQAVQYYSKWVALDDVCKVYMLQIKDTRRDLYSYLQENPTIEQAKKNVRQLAATFAADLKKDQEELEEKKTKTLEERKKLEGYE